MRLRIPNVGRANDPMRQRTANAERETKPSSCLAAAAESLDLWRNQDNELEPKMADVGHRVAALERQERSTR
jgi:hypothetical protein